MSSVHCTDYEQALKLFYLTIQKKKKTKAIFVKYDLNIWTQTCKDITHVRIEASECVQAPSPLESSEI